MQRSNPIQQSKGGTRENKPALHNSLAIDMLLINLSQDILQALPIVSTSKTSPQIASIHRICINNTTDSWLANSPSCAEHTTPQLLRQSSRPLELSSR
jgi:hypothetical protein